MALAHIQVLASALKSAQCWCKPPRQASLPDVLLKHNTNAIVQIFNLHFQRLASRERSRLFASGSQPEENLPAEPAEEQQGIDDTGMHSDDDASSSDSDTEENLNLSLAELAKLYREKAAASGKSHEEAFAEANRRPDADEAAEQSETDSMAMAAAHEQATPIANQPALQWC